MVVIFIVSGFVSLFDDTISHYLHGKLHPTGHVNEKFKINLILRFYQVHQTLTAYLLIEFGQFTILMTLTRKQTESEQRQK